MRTRVGVWRSAHRALRAGRVPEDVRARLFTIDTGSTTYVYAFDQNGNEQLLDSGASKTLPPSSIRDMHRVLLAERARSACGSRG